MKLKWSRILFWFFALFPFVFSALYYNRLPEQVATHFDSFGKPNGYSSRAFAAFGTPAIFFASVVLVAVLFKLDPKHRNISASPQIQGVVLWGIVAISNLTQGVVILQALKIGINASVVIDVAIGVFFAAIGNYLPKCKPNYTMGIRLPWTLASEENWRKTHRFAGPLWVAGGILIAASAFLQTLWVILAVTAVISIVPAVYSYLLYKKEAD